MRQNNNQQQNSSDINQSHIAPLHETSLTKKVLQLEYEMQKTEKCYHAVKKPIKYFSKVKRSLPDSKNSQHYLEPGILSQKIIPPNIGQHLTYPQKPNTLQNPKLKNVFEAYKQTLQQKYRKKKRLMEKAALKIGANKIHQNQAASEQIIHQKQELIKKRISNKRLDPCVINSHQGSPMHKSNLLQSIKQKPCSSRQLETIDDSSGHNFIRSGHKRPEFSIILPQDHYLSNRQVSIYQVKRKCYSQERENLPQKSGELNKTRNISFKLPNEKRKSTKHFIERLGGQTYNLPDICDKANERSETISYLVKSLRKPSESQHFKASISNPQINLMPKIQQPSTMQKQSKRVKTLEADHNSSIFESHQNQHFLDSSDNTQCLGNKSGSRYQLKHRKAKRKLAKYHFMGEIDPWNTQNNLPEIQSHLMHHFVSLEPTDFPFDE